MKWLSFVLPVVSAQMAFGNASYSETLYPGWSQTFAIQKVLFAEKSDYWDLILFENEIFGRVLAIDGAIQLTEKDEMIYSEMKAHVPILAHGNASSVLIVGGGDGCVLREVLKHDTVKRVVLVEIDPEVIEITKRYLPDIVQGAFDDPRVEIVIQDATQFVKESEEAFDVIICDTPDPVGPAKVLFAKEFYSDCKNRLQTGGILVNQNGVPFVQKEELALTLESRKDLFEHATFYTVAVPSYVGGFMALGWASDADYAPSLETLQERFSKIRGKTRYYTPEIHKASFALPQYILDEF